MTFRIRFVVSLAEQWILCIIQGVAKVHAARLKVSSEMYSKSRLKPSEAVLKEFLEDYSEIYSKDSSKQSSKEFPKSLEGFSTFLEAFLATFRRFS
jgi:hypothetical protein